VFAEVENVSLYLEGSWEGGGGGGGGGGGEQFNYVCTSTTTESADGRAQRTHIKDDSSPASTELWERSDSISLPSAPSVSPLLHQSPLSSISLPSAPSVSPLLLPAAPCDSSSQRSVPGHNSPVMNDRAEISPSPGCGATGTFTLHGFFKVLIYS